MRYYSFITVILFLSNFCYPQNQILDEVFGNRLKIVSVEKYTYPIELNDYDIEYYLENLYDNYSAEDSINLIRLITKYNSKLPAKENWTRMDFESVYLLRPNEKIDINKYIEIDSSRTIKEIKKEIKNYESSSNWTSIPMKISNIIESDDHTLSIIAIEYGNNGGQVSLFHMVNGKWAFVGNLKRWAY